MSFLHVYSLFHNSLPVTQPSTHLTLCLQFISTYQVEFVLPIYGDAGFPENMGSFQHLYPLRQLTLFLYQQSVANRLSDRSKISYLPVLSIFILPYGLSLNRFYISYHDLYVHMFSCPVMSRVHYFLLFNLTVFTLQFL